MKYHHFNEHNAKASTFTLHVANHTYGLKLWNALPTKDANTVKNAEDGNKNVGQHCLHLKLIAPTLLQWIKKWKCCNDLSPLFLLQLGPSMFAHNRDESHVLRAKPSQESCNKGGPIGSDQRAQGAYTATCLSQKSLTAWLAIQRTLWGTGYRLLQTSPVCPRVDRGRWLQWEGGPRVRRLKGTVALTPTAFQTIFYHR